MDLDEVSGPIRLALAALGEGIRKRDREILEKLSGLWNNTVRLIDDLQDRCLKEIALKQPFGKDFRRLAALMKISTSLERIARYVTHVAEYLLIVIDKIPEQLLRGFYELTILADKVLNDSIAAFMLEDERYIPRGISIEEEIDKRFNALRNELLETSKTSCDVDLAVYGALSARSLERIGDHSVEILRRAEYYLKGERPWTS